MQNNATNPLDGHYPTRPPSTKLSPGYRPPSLPQLPQLPPSASLIYHTAQASLTAKPVMPVTPTSPQRTKGPWSTHEDKVLMELIDVHGAVNWVSISNALQTRTPKQCRERYHQNLKASLNHDPITPEEGAEIERLVSIKGPKWAEIARMLTGRSDNAVKNWYNGNQNRKKRLLAKRRTAGATLSASCSPLEYSRQSIPTSTSRPSTSGEGSMARGATTTTTVLPIRSFLSEHSGSAAQADAYSHQPPNYSTYNTYQYHQMHGYHNSPLPHPQYSDPNHQHYHHESHDPYSISHQAHHNSTSARVDCYSNQDRSPMIDPCEHHRQAGAHSLDSGNHNASPSFGNSVHRRPSGIYASPQPESDQPYRHAPEQSQHHQYYGQHYRQVYGQLERDHQSPKRCILPPISSWDIAQPSPNVPRLDSFRFQNDSTKIRLPPIPLNNTSGTPEPRARGIQCHSGHQEQPGSMAEMRSRTVLPTAPSSPAQPESRSGDQYQGQADSISKPRFF